jgi:hypothetical protein
MNELEKALYKTRKSILEAEAETGIKYVLDSEISLKQCNSCGIWLKTMLKDLDGLDICNQCYNAYGP